MKTKSKTVRKPAAKSVAESNEVEIFDDGKLPLRIKSSGKPDRVLQLDLFLLRMACDKCEREHKLDVKDGYFVHTAKFITALAKEFSTIANQEINETFAAQLWPVVNSRWFALKKNMNETPN